MATIDSLLSPVTEEEELMALSDGLRQRKRAGDFFGMSTIPELAQMGQQQGQDVMAAAQAQGVLRKALADRQQRKEQAEAQRLLEEQRIGISEDRLGLDRQRLEYDQVQDLEEFGMDASERAREARQRRFENEMKRREVEVKERQKVGRGAGQGFKYKSQQEDWDKSAGDLESFVHLFDSWKPDYANPAETGFGRIPYAGSIANTAGRLGIGSENREDAANWWGLFEQEFNIPERHEAFGAALTATEKPLWEASTITPNMKDTYVKTRLAIKKQLMLRTAEQKVIEALRSGAVTEEDALYKYGRVIPNIEQIIRYAGDMDSYEAYRDEQAAQMAGWLESENEPSEGAAGPSGGWGKSVRVQQ